MTADQVGPQSLHWTMTYRVVRDGTVVREETAKYDWHVVSPEAVTEEAAYFGLTGTRLSDDIIVLKRI
jgi:hypothetical protein